MAIFQYRTDGGTWVLGYGTMNAELETGSCESVDLSLYGPIVGYLFKF